MDPRTATLVNRVQGWNARERGPGPYRMTLFPTNICNIKCRHCWQRWADYDKTYESELSDDRLLALVDEAAELGVKEWYFVGGGEPMARGKLIMQMIEKIRAHGMNGGIHTNGTLFRPGMLERLVELGWSHIRVSMDGPNAEINDYIRTGGFDKAIANVKHLSALKRAADTVFPNIALYTTVTNMTFDKIEEFVRLAHSCGPDVGIELSGLIIQSEGSAALNLSQDQVHKYPEYVRHGLELAEQLGVPNNFKAYLEEELVLDTMDMQRSVPKNPRGTLADAVCYEPFTSLSIMPDGAMGPCCAFFSEEALSIKEKSLADVWYGSYMQGVRQGMKEGNPPDYCQRCPSNMFVNKETFRHVARKSLLWDAMSPVARVAFMTERTANSLKQHGVMRSIKRGREWLSIRMTARK